MLHPLSTNQLRAILTKGSLHPLVGYLGVHKTLAALVSRAKWPAMRHSNSAFVAGCGTYQYINDSTMASLGLL